MFKRRGGKGFLNNVKKLQNPYFGASLMVMMRMIVVKMMIMLVALTKPSCLSSKFAKRCTIITIIICHNSSEDAVTKRTQLKTYIKVG